MSTRGELRKREWADPEIRAKRIAAIREAAFKRYQRPEERERASERTRAQMANPKQREANRAHLDALNARRRGQPGSALGKSQEAPEYKIWSAMVGRCTRPGDHSKYYLDRGIKVAPEWLGRGGFARFFAHIGPRPSAHHSLDRIENDGHYEPGNVRWATRKQQIHNSRRVRMVTLKEETLPLAEWARRIGISPPALAYRIEQKWSEDRIFSPRSPFGRRSRQL